MRHRWAVVMVLASVLILIASVVGNTAYTRSVEERARAKSEQAHRQQVTTCETTNEARANNKKLWDYLFSLPRSPEQTDKQKEQVAKFRELVDQTFAPRDCSKI